MGLCTDNTNIIHILIAPIDTINMSHKFDNVPHPLSLTQPLLTTAHEQTSGFQLTTPP